MNITKLRLINGHTDVSAEFIRELERMLDDHIALSGGRLFNGPLLTSSSLKEKFCTRAESIPDVVATYGEDTALYAGIIFGGTRKKWDWYQRRRFFYPAMHHRPISRMHMGMENSAEVEMCGIRSST